MKSITNNNVALFLCFSLFLSFLGLINAAGKNALVGEACGKAKYNDLCISSLEAEHATQDADLAALALIAIRVATNNGTETSVDIKKALDDETLEPTIEQNYEDCSDNYVSAMQQLDDALASLVSRDYKDAKTLLEAAIDAATTCENGLKDGPGSKSELFNRNNVFLQLCSNALDLVNYLATKSNL